MLANFVSEGLQDSERLEDTRLDLAALFGTMQFEQDSPVREDGSLSLSAPSFLRLLHTDLLSVLLHWTGFSAGWKTEVLALGRQCFTDLRKAELAVIAAPQELSIDRVTPREERPQKEPVQSVSSPDLVAELCVLSDGEGAGALRQVSAEEWLDGVYCGNCAAGPKALHSTCASKTLSEKPASEQNMPSVPKRVHTSLGL